MNTIQYKNLEPIQFKSGHVKELQILTPLYITGTITYEIIEDKGLDLKIVLPEQILRVLPKAISEVNKTIIISNDIQNHMDVILEVLSKPFEFWNTQYGTKITNFTIDEISYEYNGKPIAILGTPEWEEETRLVLEEAKKHMIHKTRSWTCKQCNTINTSKFCCNCGAIRLWICDCSQQNEGNFCSSCGKERIQ